MTNAESDPIAQTLSIFRDVRREARVHEADDRWQKPIDSGLKTAVSKMTIEELEVLARTARVSDRPKTMKERTLAGRLELWEHKSGQVKLRELSTAAYYQAQNNRVMDLIGSDGITVAVLDPEMPYDEWPLRRLQDFSEGGTYIKYYPDTVSGIVKSADTHYGYLYMWPRPQLENCQHIQVSLFAGQPALSRTPAVELSLGL